MIVHVITGLHRGGAESALHRLLSQAGDPSRVRVVCLGDGGVFHGRIAALGIEVHCLGMRPGLPSPFKWWRLVRMLKQWRPRIVQTWMYHADLIGGLAATAAGVPVCWGIRHGDLSAASNKRSTRFVAWLCARMSGWVPARAVFCSTRAAAMHVEFGYKAPFVVVPNGLDVQAWQPRRSLRAGVRAMLGLSDSSFLFVHAGRAHPQKDHANMAAAFNLLQVALPRARLLLCGDGLLEGSRYFDLLPFSNEARQAVIALGPRDDLDQLWQGADAFVLSSRGEAFPNVVAEAMACGLPCVVTDVGDAAEIVGETGFVVPHQDHEALGAAMLKLSSMHSDELVALGVAARERVLQRFTLERMATGFQEVWDSVIAEEAD